MNELDKDDRDALDAIVNDLARRWNAGDGERFAAPFAPDAEQVNIFGTRLIGRREIAERHIEIFNGIFRESKNDLRVTHARLAGGDIMLAGIVSIVTVPAGPLQGELRTAGSLVLRRRSGARWEILLFHNTREVPADLQPRPPGGA